MQLLEHSKQLVVVRCWCGIQHAVPESLRKEQLRLFNDNRPPFVIHCPLGHESIPAGEPEVASAKKRLVREQAAHDQTKAELTATERRRRAEKGQRTKLEKRIRVGICPYCHRHFANLANHMSTQHSTECKR